MVLITNPTLYKPEVYNKFTMEMAFTFREKVCDWSARYLHPVRCGIGANITPKLVSSCFGLKIEYRFLIKHFVLVTCIQTCVSVLL